MPVPNLSESFFYPASGLDFEPLKRFSHVCRTFVYVDWNLEPDAVEEAVQSLAGDLVLHGVPEVVRPEELMPSVAVPQAVAMPQGFRLSPYEQQAYQHRRETSVAGRSPWARRFQLIRSFGDVARELSLLYIAAEGLATYAALYGQHEAPLILCTIQSGPGFGLGWTHLERPGGTMERFLRAYRKRPRVWVRGNWGRPIEHNASGWDRPVQGYMDWNQSSVEAFVRGEDNRGLHETVALNGSDRTIALAQRPWTRDDLTGFDGCFLTPRIARKLQVEDQPNVRVWTQSCSSLIEFLESVETECQREGWQRVAAVPVGYEDEGEYLRQWMQGSRLPRQLEIRFVNELDFADLRGGL